MRILILIALIYASANASDVGDSSRGIAVFDHRLGMLVNDAIKNNEKIKATRYKVDESGKTMSITRQLDPPGIEIESMQTTSMVWPEQLSLRLKQMFPFPGKLGAMAAMEEQRGKMLGSESKTAERNLVLRVKMVFYAIYLYDRKLEINAENQALAKRFIEIARKQYEVGMGTQSDILRGQTELSKLQNEAIVLGQSRQSMVAMLNALLSRPVTAEVSLIDEIVPVQRLFSLEQVAPIAEQHRPELLAMQSNVMMQKAEMALNKKERYPDFEIKGGYTYILPSSMDIGTPEKDSWGIMADFSVPLAPWSGRRYSEAIARSDLRTREAEAELADMRNMVRAEVQDALLKVSSTQEQIKLLKLTVIPQTRQMLESTLSAYQTGKLEFLMLIDAERMLLMAQEQYHLAVMNYLSAIASLERAIGIDIGSIFVSENRELK